VEKTNSHDRCIYTVPGDLCSGTSPLHPKEHYLPAGLGNFKDDVRLKNFICYDCQRRFSKFEEVFLRNSGEAFLRKIVGVQGRKGHKSKNIFVEPTQGLSPLTVKGLYPAMPHELLWEMTSEGQGSLLDQLVFKKVDGTLEHIPIREGKVAQDLARFGDEWESWQLVACIAKDQHESELQAVLGPALEGMPTIPVGDSPESVELEGEAKARITLPYAQAISKIAFHFVLAHFHFTGFEPEFHDLKRFIYAGTGTNPARIVEDVLLPQLVPEQARLRNWSHVVSAEFNRDGFFSRMQFFAGPRLKPFVWRVELGTNPSRVLQELAVGVRFYYYDQPDSSGYSGAIEKLKLGPKMLAKL
jgi:hypothetical protein